MSSLLSKDLLSSTALITAFDDQQEHDQDLKSPIAWWMSSKVPSTALLSSTAPSSTAPSTTANSKKNLNNYERSTTPRCIVDINNNNLHPYMSHSSSRTSKYVHLLSVHLRMYTCSF